MKCLVTQCIIESLITKKKAFKFLSRNLFNGTGAGNLDRGVIVVCVLTDPSTSGFHLQVAARNRFAPSIEILAAQDHRMNITGSVHKPARLRFRCDFVF